MQGGENIMTYKVTNKLEQAVRYKDILFRAGETKMLDEKPTSDKFHIETDETKEKPKKVEGGKR